MLIRQTALKLWMEIKTYLRMLLLLRIIIIRDLTTAGAVGGINRLFYTETRHLIAAAAENRLHFVENCHPEQKVFAGKQV